jgi:redox-sensitive bicupin YhaK (pirin superfamily)
MDPARKGYVFLVRGELEVNAQTLRAGDAALIEGERQIALHGGKDAEVLVFDLAV